MFEEGDSVFLKVAPRVCSPDKESDLAVCKLTSESILARMDCV